MGGGRQRQQRRQRLHSNSWSCVQPLMRIQPLMFATDCREQVDGTTTAACPLVRSSHAERRAVSRLQASSSRLPTTEAYQASPASSQLAGQPLHALLPCRAGRMPSSTKAAKWKGCRRCRRRRCQQPKRRSLHEARSDCSRCSEHHGDCRELAAAPVTHLQEGREPPSTARNRGSCPCSLRSAWLAIASAGPPSRRRWGTAGWRQAPHLSDGLGSMV